MEIKKSKSANLEKQKGTSFLIGLVIVLALIFASFEFTTKEVKVHETGPVYQVAMPEEDIIPITEPVLTVPTAPIVIEVPEVPEILNIVEDKEEIKEEETVESVEDTNEAIQGIAGPPVHSGPVVAGPVGPTVEANDEDEIFQVVEQNPEFPGGMDALTKYLSKNLKYPNDALDQGAMGRIFVTFVVNKDGSVVDAKVMNNTMRGGGKLPPSCEKEAIRVVEKMPKWTPGRQRGKTVRVQYNLPIQYVIAG